MRNNNKFNALICVLRLLLPILCAGCEVTDSGTIQAWENSCQFAHEKQINTVMHNAREYVSISTGQDVDAHDGHILKQGPIYYEQCTYHDEAGRYICLRSDKEIHSRFEYMTIDKSLHGNGDAQQKDKNYRLIHSYAIYDRSNGSLLAASAQSSVVDYVVPATGGTHFKTCGDYMIAEEVLKPN